MAIFKTVFFLISLENLFPPVNLLHWKSYNLTRPDLTQADRSGRRLIKRFVHARRINFGAPAAASASAAGPIMELLFSIYYYFFPSHLTHLHLAGAGPALLDFF